MCDIGCGVGLVLNELANKYDLDSAIGFEPSQDVPQNEDDANRVKVLNEDASSYEGTFDVSIMMDVFEHVEDYFGFLRNVKHLANVHVFHIPLDATVLHLLHNGFLKTRNSAGHLHYFTPETAVQTLKDTGYSIMDSQFTKMGWEGPGRKPNSLFNLTRRLLFAINRRWAQKILGGVSLMVLARAD